MKGVKLRTCHRLKGEGPPYLNSTSNTATGGPSKRTAMELPKNLYRNGVDSPPLFEAKGEGREKRAKCRENSLNPLKKPEKKSTSAKKPKSA